MDHEVTCYYYRQLRISTRHPEPMTSPLSTKHQLASYCLSWHLTVWRNATYYQYIADQTSKKSNDFIPVWHFELSKRKIQNTQPLHLYVRHEINYKSCQDCLIACKDTHPVKVWANTILTESSPELSHGGLIWGHSVTSQLTNKTTNTVRFLWAFC